MFRVFHVYEIYAIVKYFFSSPPLTNLVFINVLSIKFVLQVQFLCLKILINMVNLKDVSAQKYVCSNLYVFKNLIKKS